MRKTKIFAIGLLLFMGLQLLLFIPHTSNQFVSAGIDTLVLEDDFEEKYYNNIYSQYENATVTLPSSSYTLRPNAIGTHSQLSPAGDTPAWKCLDEISPNDDTDYLQPLSLTVEHTTTVNIENSGSASGTILNVTIYFRAKKTINDGYYYLTIKTLNGNLYNTSIPITFAWTTYTVVYTINPQTSSAWTWNEIDALELGGSSMKLGTYGARFTQVYCIVNFEPSPEIGSTTIHKQQNTSYYRAFGGLYSYYHNIPINYTHLGETIKHNSSIIINFVTLHVFPQALEFFFYFNCFYNVSLFIGTEEYVLLTHDYSIEDWRYISIDLDRRNYLILDLDVDFYIKIYPIENNNTHDVFYMDNLAVKYTDPEPTIDFDGYIGGVGETKEDGLPYADYVTSNITSSSCYLSSSGENNPDGWLEWGTSHSYIYDTWSNPIMSRGVTLTSSWTLKDYLKETVRTYLMTDIDFTVDKDYRISEKMYFEIGSLSDILVMRTIKFYVDDILVDEITNSSFIGKSYYDTYFEFFYKIEFVQLNEKTIQYNSLFTSIFGNATDFRPYIFSINEEIQSGLNVLNYFQKTRYIAHSGQDSNCIIYQKVTRDIHNSPISDFTIPDIEGGFFRNIWDILMNYVKEATGLEGFLWQQLNLERAYQELLVDMISDMTQGINDPDWLDNYYEDIQNIQDTYAGGIVSTWRNLFSNDDYSSIESRFDERWGSLVTRGARGEESIFTRLFSGIFGEDISFIPQLIFEFFNNFKNWIVIFFVMYIIWLMRSIMTRDWDRVRKEIGTMVSLVVFIVKLIQWLIGFVIRILTMIGGFIPFT